LNITKKFHFIGLGDGTTNDLAIELKKAGHSVTGSYEGISDEEKHKLLKYNIIAENTAPEGIDKNIDSVILGPLTSKGNAELMRVQDLQLPVYSLPDFIYEAARDKLRLVIAGNRGKTLIASLIIHVLRFHKRKFDFFTGAQPTGFDSVVKLSDAPLIVIEGQDVNASVLDATPCFLKYHHHVAVINGIEWQASSLYPTRDEYVRQFGLFGASTPKGGVLIYFELDPVVAALPSLNKPDVLFIPYKTHPSIVDGGHEYLVTPEKAKLQIKISGKHNMQNISAAQETLKRIGVTNEMFYQAVPSFEAPAH
jgi:UDP-N-acetylmuramate: L-alanyl-gamma-D-glutamyl-meso-diaminopimelate ligase